MRLRHRGIAEIEMLFSVAVFIILLTLSVAAVRIAVARLDSRQSAGYEAFHDATDTLVPQYADSDLAPLPGIDSIRPGLPLRTHVPYVQTTVPVYIGASDSLPPATVGGAAALVGPAWTVNSYPAAGDDQTTGGWFTQFAAESHGELVDPFVLQPAWRP